ncbi:hypothetical protein CHS0354_000431 [Potamilus streckersoni]|uniref:TonB C-terminal domain-containing protein n=1 Tax=Potamilus streckersoni TaxID=2493646 RepID=A0AAE0T7B4_9BIVA|nr:hypothetical protein CHS0354_000431 [Potamilus streckersoni]
MINLSFLEKRVLLRRKIDRLWAVLVKVDYLDTERLRGVNYGTLELRKRYHKFMALGIGASIGMFVSFFLMYIIYGWVVGLLQDDLALKRKRIIDVSELAPPPSLDEKPKPPPPPIKPPEAPGIGEVKEVKDEEAPRQKTVAVQDLLKEASDDTSGLASAPIVDVPAGGGSSDDPPEFVSVEKEPDFAIRVQFDYPESARRAGLEGKVFLRVLVGKDGRSEKVQVLKSSGSDILDRAAKESLEKSTYTPALQNGQPVRTHREVLAEEAELYKKDQDEIKS